MVVEDVLMAAALQIELLVKAVLVVVVQTFSVVVAMLSAKTSDHKIPTKDMISGLYTAVTMKHMRQLMF